MDAERSKFGPKVARERIIAVDVGGAWCDLRSREGAHAFAQHIGCLAEAEIETCETACKHQLAFPGHKRPIRPRQNMVACKGSFNRPRLRPRAPLGATCAGAECRKRRPQRSSVRPE